jgi:sialate O-acetylesterase
MIRTSFPRLFCVLATGAALLPGFLPLDAEVKPACAFTNHMVLQRDMKVPVWGTAQSGEDVTVAFAGQKKSVKAGADGTWRVDLDPLPASAEGRTLTLTGSATAQPVQLDDVLVGEVWLASGQSNMTFPISKAHAYYAGVNNEEQEIAAANYPLIRMFTAAMTKAHDPQTSVPGQWLVCSPETAPDFSAVGYFFARDLQKELKVPVGILTVAFGASTAEAWIRRDTLAADPLLKPMLDQFDTAYATFKADPNAAAKYADAKMKYEAVAAQAKAQGQKPPKGPSDPDPSQNQHSPTVLFNAMIHPVLPYAIRGVIWYQGESVVGGAAGRALYPQVQETLVRDWRRLWGEGDFPFYIVQLAALDNASNNPEIREAQATVLKLKNTGMAVTIDIGDPKNVHPKDKQDVGDRLTRIALANAYGHTIEFSGPRYDSMKVEGGAIRLSFTHLGGGLVAKDPPLKWFTVAGADMKFVPADAKIDGDTVVVSSAQVPSPAAVRYAWSNYPDGCNLYNAAGLPAAPFRTDNEPFPVTPPPAPTTPAPASAPTPAAPSAPH